MNPNTILAMTNLCSALISQGKFSEAEKLYRTVWKFSVDSIGEDHPSTLGTMRDLSEMLEKQGKHEEAEELHKKMIKIQQENQY